MSIENKQEGNVVEAEHYDAGMAEEVAPHLHAKTYLVLFAIFVISFTQVMLLTVSAAYSTILGTLLNGSDRSSWLVSSVLLPTVVLAVPVCQAADYWGRRWFMIVLTGLGFVGSLITSRATNIKTAIVGQAITGPCLANAALAYAIVSEVLPHRHRMTGQAVPAIGNAVGAITGLLSGAALIDPANPSNFRILFYIIAGLFAVSTAICYFCYDPPLRELQTRLTFHQKIHALDWIGGFLLSSGLLMVCIAFSWAENPYPYRNAHVLAPLLIAFGLLVAFGVYEWKFKTDGMLNHRLFARDRNLALALVAIFFEGFIYIAGNIYLPFQVSTLYETRALLVGATVSVAWGGYILASIAGAVYTYRYKQLRLVIVAGFSSFLIFNACMATSNLNSRQAVWGYSIFLGAALGMGLNAVVSIAQFSAPPELIATTSGLLATFRGLGSSSGSAICTALFGTKLAQLMPRKIAEAVLPLGVHEDSLPAVIAALAGHHPEDLVGVPGVDDAVIEAGTIALNSAFLQSFKYIWIMAASCSAGAIVLSGFFKDMREDFNLKIDAPAESEQALYSDGIKPHRKA